MTRDELFAALEGEVKNLGADRAAVIDASEIALDARFRTMCEANSCGVYGKCWMCPPDIGEIDALMEEIKSYPGGLMYQSISAREDSFDFEGMQEAGHRHSEKSRLLDEALRRKGHAGFLHLSKGGCDVCSTCAKASGKPCRFPQKAISSLEAYGVNVGATVKRTAMQYINGANTVTYFGLVLFKENDLCHD